MRTLALALTLYGAASAAAQSRAPDLIAAARAQARAHNVDSAVALLRLALDSAARPSTADRENALVLRGLLQYSRDDESLTRRAFREALSLDPGLQVAGLGQVDPRLEQILNQERAALVEGPAPAGVLGGAPIAAADSGLIQPPRRVSGPDVAYPGALLARRVAGRVVVIAVVDTTGAVEPASIQMLQSPDTAFDEPVRQMMLASRFAPATVNGRPVRAPVRLQLDLRVGEARKSATDLVRDARALLARRPDSALVLVRLARDSANHPTRGDVIFSLLVEAVARHERGQDTLSRQAGREALQRLDAARAGGVDFAPVVLGLADSVAHALRLTPRAPRARSLTPL